MQFVNKFFVCLLALVGRIPGRRRVGAALGRAALPLMRRRRRVAEKNLQAAFPQMADVERRRLLRRHFAALGEWFMDTLWGLSARRGEILRAVRLEGELSPPCLLLTPHFLGLDLALLRLGVEGVEEKKNAALFYYYKPFHNKFWDGVINTLRQRMGAEGLPTSSPTALLAGVRRLRRGGALCYLPDIDPKMRKSTVFAPFLGADKTATTAALPRLAAAAKVPVVPTIVCREKNGYVLRLLPPLADFPGAASAEDNARRMNGVIGEWVERQPENYFWLHRRFKTSADGAGIYG